MRSNVDGEKIMQQFVFRERPSQVPLGKSVEENLFWKSQTSERNNVEFFQKDIRGHFGCVNALEFCPKDESLLASGTFAYWAFLA